MTISLTGNLTVGERAQSASSDDIALRAPSYNERAGIADAGLLARIDRRTARTTTMLTIPAGIASQGSDLGELQASYYTPRYALMYGGQPLGVLGGVPLGTTLRGVALTLPLSGGDLTFFDGPSYGEGRRLARLFGLRARRMVRSTLFELGLDRVRIAGSNEQIASAILGFASTRGRLSQVFESSLQQRSNVVFNPAFPLDTANPRSFAYQYRADLGGDRFYTTLSLRHIGDGYVSFGSGQVLRDDLASLGVRADDGSTSLGLDEGLERSGDGIYATLQRHGALSFAHTFAKQNVTTAATFTEQRTRNVEGVQWTGGIGAQLGLTLAGVNALLGGQAQRTSSNFSAPLTLVGYTGELQRQFGSIAASAGFQLTRQIGRNAFSLVSEGNVAFTRNLGATALTLDTTVVHTQTAASDAVQTTPLLTVSRRISRVASIALTYGLQRVRDRLDPAADGRTRIFSVQISAPFAVGNGMVQGRVDPRLPATIAGSVVNDMGGQTLFTGAIDNGVGNVVVILDNSVVQRTDLLGRFQFDFVQPGEHQVRLETASLPRGVTADQPYASVAVQGGQTGQVFFRIGTLGAISGHVLGRDADGQTYPLPGVTLRIDGRGFATTDRFGAYGFGRLTEGTHAVEVDTQSLPANVSFGTKNEEREVQVRNGEISRLDFITQPLGSIAGTVLFDRSLAPEHRGGALNAYVVAEPGDHAAIAGQDGSFLLDDLPAGRYVLDLDPETLPSGTGNESGPLTVTLAGDAHVTNVLFKVGLRQKPVLFTLLPNVPPATMSLSEPVLPPGGATQVFVDPGEKARAVSVRAFGKRYQLRFDRARRRWEGEVIVPLGEPRGVAQLVAEVNGDQAAQATGALTVDPRLPLALLVMTPRNPFRGEYVTVDARFLTQVAPGDEIRWQDGQVTRLGRPIAGRVFAFTVRVSRRPLRGLLLTRGGKLPILLR